MFMVVLFIIAKSGNNSLSTNYEWISKIVYPHSRKLFSSKKEVLMYATTWMNLKDIVLNERS
jgi:hypothetical protein